MKRHELKGGVSLPELSPGRTDITRKSLRKSVDLLVSGSGSRPSSSRPSRPTTAKNSTTRIKSVEIYANHSDTEDVIQKRTKKDVPTRIELPPWNGSTKTHPSVSVKLNPPKPVPVSAEATALEFQAQKLIRQLSIETEKRDSFCNGSLSALDTVTSHPYKRLFHPTPYQLELANMALPSMGEPPAIPLHQLIQTQMFALTEKIPLYQIQTITNKLCSDINVLTMTILKNQKILDADVQFFIDFTPFEDVPLTKYVEFFTMNIDPAKPAVLQLHKKKEDWIKTFSSEKQFGVLVIDAKAAEYQQFMLVGCSPILTDEFSLSFITKQILLNSAFDQAETFEDYCSSCVRSRNDLPFWRSQCILVQQENLEFRDQKIVEQQLKGLEKERASLKTSLVTATRRRNECENELSKLREQRMAMEKELNGDGQVSSFTDPTTGEIHFVSTQTKQALIKTVLGDAAGHTIVPLLEKHEVPIEVQRKIGANQLDLEAFGGLTEASVEHLNLNSRDKRQILALSEYVANRIKECIQEQGKVKFTLERKIAKATRELESAIDNLDSTKKRFDANEDMSYRLQTILHPPLEEKKILPLQLESLYDLDIPKSDFGIINPWSSTRYVITSEVLDNLRKFRSDWTLNIRNKKKMKRLQDGNQSSDNESLLETDADEEDLKTKTEKNLKQSVDAVVLAAFGVLMKHICGNEIFLVGVKVHFRSKGLVVGPLSDILPVRLDFSRKDMSFSSLFTPLYKMFKLLKRHGSACPSTYLAKELKMDFDFKVQFEFINHQEFLEYQKLGFTVEELLAPQEIQNIEKGDRLWSNNPQDQYDLKFIFVETDDQLECAVRFRQEKFDADRINKWIVKFQSTLEGIDCSRRKLSVSSMISR